MHILVDPGTNLDLIQPFIYQEISRGGEIGRADKRNLVPLKNLKQIALMKNVRLIIPLYPSFNI